MNSVAGINKSFSNPYFTNREYQSARYYTPQYEQEPETFEPVKTTAAAGILQLFAMFLAKASDWVGKKLMMGSEFTTEANVIKTAEHMVKKNKLNVTVDFITKEKLKNYGTGLQDALIPVAKGENAFYADSLKLAVAPKSKPSLILHELGHAVNSSKGNFLKFLQKSRGYVAAVPTALVMLNGLLQRNDEKPNFIERNAIAIGLTSFLPTIAEEGLASLRGIKAAKEVLGKTVKLGALKRNYAFAWMTYVIAGLSLGVAAKQAIIENKRN